MKTKIKPKIKVEEINDNMIKVQFGKGETVKYIKNLNRKKAVKIIKITYTGKGNKGIIEYYYLIPDVGWVSSYGSSSEPICEKCGSLLKYHLKTFCFGYEVINNKFLESIILAAGRAKIEYLR